MNPKLFFVPYMLKGEVFKSTMPMYVVIQERSQNSVSLNKNAANGDTLEVSIIFSTLT